MAREIPLSKGVFTIVDDEDYERLSEFRWWVDAYGYALMTTRGGRSIKKNVRMHRMIMGAPHDSVVDHIDGDPLNNQKSNLRIVTQAENTRNCKPRKCNMSGFKGVGWYKHYQKWQVRVNYEGKAYHVGYFDDKIEAARAYNAKASELFGEYARLNVIPGEESA